VVSTLALQDSACWWSLLAERLVHGLHGQRAQCPRWMALPAAHHRQDGCPLPHPSCRHFHFQTPACVGFLRVAGLLPLTCCTCSGWDRGSTFALSNANGCRWVSVRDLSCPPEPTLDRDIPYTCLACKLPDVEQNSEPALILQL